MVLSRNALLALHTVRAFIHLEPWRWVLLASAAAMLALDVAWTREVLESRPPPPRLLLAEVFCGALGLGLTAGPGADAVWAALASVPLLVGVALASGVREPGSAAALRAGG